MSWAWDSESDESCHSDSDDSLFVPSEAPSGNGEDQTARNTRNTRTGEARGQGKISIALVPVRNGLIGRKRQRSVESFFSDFLSDSEDTRSPHRHTDSEEPEAARAAPRRRGRPRTRREREDSDSNDEEGGQVRQTRKNAKVVEAVWTPEKTVRITYNKAVKHACINPIHGKGKNFYSVLHLVRCAWKHNVSLMKATPSLAKPKLYQYSHKICEACMDKYGPHCFKCDPSDGAIVPKLNTVFGEVAIVSVEDFTDAVRKWQQRREDIQASYLVLHCTVLGPEARFLRRKFDLKRRTKVHVVYSDVRDRMEPAGSGQNLEDSKLQSVWKTVMRENVRAQESQPLVSFFGNILLNDGVTFRDFRVNDLLLMYHPEVFSGALEAGAMRASINTLALSRRFAAVVPSDCCLRDAVVHSHREPRTVEDDGLVQHGNLVASLLYKNARRQFGEKLCAEFEHRAVMLVEDLKVGEDGQKVPFRKLFAARGGEVAFRRVENATQDVAARGGDMRSRVCSVDTSGFELVCWTARGAPGGGEFVVPGLMYKFETRPGSALVFRPRRYFHATLPASNRDLKNEKFAASLVTPI